MTVEENLQLMITLDDALNSQDWDIFKKRRSEDTAVYWPGRLDMFSSHVYGHYEKSYEDG